MALRHVVLFDFLPEADAAVIDQIIGQLNGLPAVIGEIRQWAIEEDVGRRAYSRRFALIATFDSMEALQRYLEHPAHVRVVEQAWPLVGNLTEHDHETETP